MKTIYVMCTALALALLSSCESSEAVTFNRLNVVSYDGEMDYDYNLTKAILTPEFFSTREGIDTVFAASPQTKKYYEGYVPDGTEKPIGRLFTLVLSTPQVYVDTVTTDDEGPINVFKYPAKGKYAQLYLTLFSPGMDDICDGEYKVASYSSLYNMSDVKTKGSNFSDFLRLGDDGNAYLAVNTDDESQLKALFGWPIYGSDPSSYFISDESQSLLFLQKQQTTKVFFMRTWVLEDGSVSIRKGTMAYDVDVKVIVKPAVLLSKDTKVPFDNNMGNPIKITGRYTGIIPHSDPVAPGYIPFEQTVISPSL